MTTPVREKLIEASIALETINVASAREKSIRHGRDPPPGAALRCDGLCESARDWAPPFIIPLTAWRSSKNFVRAGVPIGADRDPT
jgi:hypothetical protein